MPQVSKEAVSAAAIILKEDTTKNFKPIAEAVAAAKVSSKAFAFVGRYIPYVGPLLDAVTTAVDLATLFDPSLQPPAPKIDCESTAESVVTTQARFLEDNQNFYR
jgi:hypothetical protein